MKKKIRVRAKSECSGCSACVSICPRQCIFMKEDNEGFLYPIINKKQCIECGLCQKVCPVSGKKKDVHALQVYAAVNKNSEDRENSSSGGVFIALARKIIGDGGVVYGAVFDDEWMVHHIGTSSMEKVHSMQGSKYVQSRMDNCFCEIKSLLEQQKIVLFTGTPCQNAGLRAFLQKDYSNLFCIDIVCHGVPSPKVWRKYLDFLNNKHGLKREDGNVPSFRSKIAGWNNYSLSIPVYKGDYCYSNEEDFYLKTFISNIDLRPSCYNCHFKPSISYSDITIADFWGIENLCEDMRDDRGTSLVIINSAKGEKLFEAIKSALSYRMMKYDDAIRGNTSAISSVEQPSDRKRFFLMLALGRDIMQLLKWVHYQTYGRMLGLYIKGIIKKITQCIRKLWSSSLKQRDSG